MNEALTFTCAAHFGSKARGRRVLKVGQEPMQGLVEPGRVPRVARLMALAIRLDGYLQDGVVASQAELAALGQVTRARISQIMNLLNLAPDLQEALLFLPRTLCGRDSVILRDVQPIASASDWRKQRRMWQELVEGGQS